MPFSVGVGRALVMMPDSLLVMGMLGTVKKDQLQKLGILMPQRFEHHFEQYFVAVI
jgi:hypothetical protein